MKKQTSFWQNVEAARKDVEKWPSWMKETMYFPASVSSLGNRKTMKQTHSKKSARTK